MNRGIWGATIARWRETLKGLAEAWEEGLLEEKGDWEMWLWDLEDLLKEIREEWFDPESEFEGDDKAGFLGLLEGAKQLGIDALGAVGYVIWERVTLHGMSQEEAEESVGREREG